MFRANKITEKKMQVVVLPQLLLQEETINPLNLLGLQRTKTIFSCI